MDAGLCGRVMPTSRALCNAAVSSHGVVWRAGRRGLGRGVRDGRAVFPLWRNRIRAAVQSLKLPVSVHGVRGAGCSPSRGCSILRTSVAKCHTSTKMPQGHEREKRTDAVDADHDGLLDADPAGGIVALGKFDALHVGHRSLAVQAASMGTPWILSFSGIAEVLGWQPRMPIVAACDRQRVIRQWGEVCGGKIPQQVSLKFSEVRGLSPEAFVRLLAEDLLVKGVVVGQNYRFGYRAAGTVKDLELFGKQFGLDISVVDSVTFPFCGSGAGSVPAADSGGVDGIHASPGNDLKVSSTRVRQALSEGDSDLAAALLGRRHRLMVALRYGGVIKVGSNALRVPRGFVLNQAPKDGSYACALSFYGRKRTGDGAADDTDVRRHLVEKKFGPVRVLLRDGNLQAVCENGVFDGAELSQSDYLAFDF